MSLPLTTMADPTTVAPDAATCNRATCSDPNASWSLHAVFYNTAGQAISSQDIATQATKHLSSTPALVLKTVTTPAESASVKFEAQASFTSGWVSFSQVEISRLATQSSATKYYFASNQRVAMRTCNSATCSDPTYLLSDHLGSTSITTDVEGNLVSETRYNPWGEVRHASGLTPTDYTYTDQYSYMDDPTTAASEGFGLMFYNARWYDPYLNHFTQPDSIIPNPSNVLDWNRYSYVRYNPLKYTDPSGHMVSTGNDKEAGCSGKGPKCIIDMYARAGDYEGEDDSLRHYIRRHPDYNPFEDEDLDDEDKAQVAIAMFQADAEDVAQIEDFWVRTKASIETLINNFAPVALTAIIVNGGDTDGDGRPDTQGGGRPRSNLAQNKQFQGAVLEIEGQLGRRLSKTEIQQLHYALHDLENPGFWQIVNEGLGMFK